MNSTTYRIRLYRHPFLLDWKHGVKGTAISIGSITERYGPVTEKRCDKLSVDDPYPQFPDELKALPRWVLWKSTKIPFDPKTGNAADTTDSSTWSDYSTAVARCAGYAGVGLVIGPPFCAIDLDKCRNAGSGETEAWAEAIIKEVNSYAELSPSGTGFHIWICGDLPEGRRRAGRVEMYNERRYFTTSGLHVAGTPLTVERRDLRSLPVPSPHPGHREEETGEAEATGFFTFGFLRLEI